MGRIRNLIEYIIGKRKEPDGQVTQSRTNQQSEKEPVEKPAVAPLPYKPVGVRILFIADTHGYLREEEVEQVRNCTADAIIFLGDHGIEKIAVEDIIQDRIPMFGIMGNHDSSGCYSPSKGYHYIQDIGNTVTTIAWLRVAALDGSFRYKDVPDYCLYTQEEMQATAEGLQEADICISHAAAWDGEPLQGLCHDGMIGITDYIEKYQIPIHIHGHMHVSGEKILRNGCRSIGVYRLQELEL